MTTIEYDEAQSRLHDMWRAVLNGEEVLFVHNGAPLARMSGKMSGYDREALVDELRQDIGVEFTPRT